LIAALGIAFGLVACSDDNEEKGPIIAGGHAGTEGKPPFDYGAGGTGTGEGEAWNQKPWTPGNGGTGGYGGSANCISVHVDGKDTKILEDGWAGKIVPNLFESKLDFLTLSLRLPSAGTFDLGSADNVDMETCTQCMMALIDVPGEEPDPGANKKFFQKSGTLTIASSLTSMMTGVVDATAKNVVMVEVAEKSPGVIEEVEGGACLRVSTARFSVEPIPGWTCGVWDYKDGVYCDCDCGVYDPDCDVATITKIDGCLPWVTKCGKDDDGAPVCEGSDDWTCSETKWNDGLCDCKCGMWDPACDNATAASDPTDCLAGETCVKEGGKPVCKI